MTDPNLVSEIRKEAMKLLPQDNNFIHDVKEFERANGTYYEGKPRRLPDPMNAFLIKHMKRDLDGWMAANYAKNPDLELFALVKLLGLAITVAVRHGWDLEEAWKRAQAHHKEVMHGEVKPTSNMPDLGDLVR